MFVYGKGVKIHVPSSGMKAGNSPQALSSGSGPETLSLSSLICSFEFHKPKLRVVDDFRQSQMNRLAHSSVQRFAQQFMDTKTSLDAFQHLAEFSMFTSRTYST